MLRLRLCYSDGHEDTSGSLSHVTVHTGEHGSVHSLPKGSRGLSFRGWLKNDHCLHYYTFPCSCLVLSWASLCTAFYTGVSQSLTGQVFFMTAHIRPRSHRWRGPLLPGYRTSLSLGRFTSRPPASHHYGHPPRSSATVANIAVAGSSWRSLDAECYDQALEWR